MENPIKIDDLGAPLFSETSINIIPKNPDPETQSRIDGRNIPFPIRIGWSGEIPILTTYTPED